MGDRLILKNPDRKMTEDQERLSQRGLSFVSERDGKEGMMIPNLAGMDEPKRGPLLLSNNIDSDSD